MLLLLVTTLVSTTLSGCAALENWAIPNQDFSANLQKPINHTQALKNTAKPAKVSTDSSQIGRYVTISNDATRAQINPLLAVSTFTFSPTVATVGEAVQQVLANTGYRLASHLSSDVKQTLLQPLPITNRHLGPLSIQETLEILMGEEVFTLQRDPLNRLVNFKVKPSIAKVLGVKDE